MTPSRSLLVATTAVLAISACRTATPPQTGTRPATNAPGAVAQGQDTARGGQQAGGAPGGAPAEPRPRPYNRVVTAEAQSRAGLFKTHRVGSRLLFEIPRSALNKEMLLVTRAARVPVNAGYGGQQIGARRVGGDSLPHRYAQRLRGRCPRDERHQA